MAMQLHSMRPSKTIQFKINLEKRNKFLLPIDPLLFAFSCRFYVYVAVVCIGRYSAEAKARIFESVLFALNCCNKKMPYLKEEEK